MVRKIRVVALICFQAIICLLRMQKPVSECYVIWSGLWGQLWSGMSIAHLRTTWCNRRAAHPKEECREFAL